MTTFNPPSPSFNPQLINRNDTFSDNTSIAATEGSDKSSLNISTYSNSTCCSEFLNSITKTFRVDEKTGETWKRTQFGLNHDPADIISYQGQSTWTLEECQSRKEYVAFVANLRTDRDTRCLEYLVKQHFSRWGMIKRVSVQVDEELRPFAFVHFKTLRGLNETLVKGQGSMIQGRSLRLELGKTNRTLFVQALNKRFSAEDIWLLFSTFGPLDGPVDWQNFPIGDYKGRGFVRFHCRRDALNAYNLFSKNAEWNIQWREHKLLY